MLYFVMGKSHEEGHGLLGSLFLFLGEAAFFRLLARTALLLRLPLDPNLGRFAGLLQAEVHATRVLSFFEIVDRSFHGLREEVDRSDLAVKESILDADAVAVGPFQLFVGLAAHEPFGEFKSMERVVKGTRHLHSCGASVLVADNFIVFVQV